MMKQYDTIPAEAERPCDCCGRVHRKLHYVDGYWLGETCAEDYKIYKRNSDITSIYWKGWEKKYHKVDRMVHGRCSACRGVGEIQVGASDPRDCSFCNGTGYAK